LGLRAEISVFLEGQSKSSKELRGALPGRGRVAEAEGERPAGEFCGARALRMNSDREAMISAEK
jgi:hypothetical protein